VKRAFEAAFSRLVRHGRLELRWPDGSRSVLGNGAQPSAAVALRDRAAIRRLVLNPALAVGEAYMDGGLEPIGCTIYDVLEVLVMNLAQGGSMPALRVSQTGRKLIRRLSQFNPAGRSRRNVAHHYDLNSELYSLFLDEDWQYSCAYFPRGDETLEAAQVAKKRHIAAKLLLDRPDLTVLDIGCGWGGMALTLARDYGARVTGITLSTEQLAAARARAEAAGLSHRVKFELLDYRGVDQSFDRVVSVGMFEHVGVTHYRTFFNTLQGCLADDGVALMHFIGSAAAPAATNPWLAKYIFPGGYSPSLSEVMPGIEASGLIATDVEVLRLHYARTLRHWRDRFEQNREAVKALYDERFCRMFEFYLAGCELAFRYSGEVVFQMQLSRQLTTVPLTRDYIGQAERAGRWMEAAD
jgi:cyclopropane-fatty-acyl-phospholipid synthase